MRNKIVDVKSHSPVFAVESRIKHRRLYTNGGAVDIGRAGGRIVEENNKLHGNVVVRR
jgi:hypothetical protein